MYSAKRDRTQSRPRDYDSKGGKRVHHEQEETVIEEPLAYSDPADLRNYITNQQTIDHLQSIGIKGLFPIQYSTFRHIHRGQDVRGKDKTGSGKTLAFSLPVIERLRQDGALKKSPNPKFLIVLPTRELVIQVIGNIENLRLRPNELGVVGVYGGDSIGRQLQRVEEGCDVVVATPGRLIDFINRGAINFSSIEVVCLDEADQMLNMGFQKDIEKIFEEVERKAGKKTQNLLFSATFPSWVERICQKYLSRGCPFIDLVKNNEKSTPSTIKHYLMSVRKDEKGGLLRKIRDKFCSRQGRCIIFCETKRDVNEMCELVGTKDCAMLHGDVKQRDREFVYKDFKSGRVLTVVATNVAARGLDFPDIELVIQTEPPRDPESYIHRSGRTGRAGKKGVCVLMQTRRDEERVRKIEDEGKVVFENLRNRDV